MFLDSSTPEEDLDETKQELEDTNENLFIYPKFYIDELYQKRDKNKFEERLNCRDEPKKEVTFTDISRYVHLKLLICSKSYSLFKVNMFTFYKK